MSTGGLPRLTARPSIYEFLAARVDATGSLEDSEVELPDAEEAVRGGLRFAAGAVDGAFRPMLSDEDAARAAAAVAGALLRAAARPSRRRLARLSAELAGEDDVLDFLAPMIDLVQQDDAPRSQLHAVARWLATTATGTGAVKVGLAVLGATGVGDDLDVVRLLGAHEELALYAGLAVAWGTAEPESELWRLASRVHGWGRVQCVRLLAGTEDPAIRSWILREGFRTSVLDAYLAHIAATTGGLLEALCADEVDRELLTAAGEILVALATSDVDQGLDDYLDGARAVDLFLTHMASRAQTLQDFHAVAVLRSYAEDGDVEVRSAPGWTPTFRQALRARCTEILDRDEWGDRITVGLLSDDETELWLASQAARTKGIDTFERHVQMIRTDPYGTAWFEAWEQADRVRAERLVELAREMLSVDDLATGPADAAGFGPQWRRHRAFDWTLQALRGHAGTGGDLVLAGLRSPAESNRFKSLSILETWPRQAWPAGSPDLAAVLADSDPSAEIRELAGAILRDRDD
jgi:hypothetical protein